MQIYINNKNEQTISLIELRDLIHLIIETIIPFSISFNSTNNALYRPPYDEPPEA